MPCPHEEAEQLPSRVPKKAQHVFGLQRLSALSGERFDAPAQVLAPPGCEPMTAGCIPDKSQRCEQDGPFSSQYSWPLLGALTLPVLQGFLAGLRFSRYTMLPERMRAP